MKKVAIVLALAVILPMQAWGQSNALRKAAEAGDPEAQYKLAWSLWNIDDLFNSDTEQWLIKAANQGYAKAQYDLGGYYMNPETFQPDASHQWFKMAFENFMSMSVKDAEVEYYIGQCYSRGEGVKEDMAKGLMWTLLSANHGNTDAMFSLGSDFYSVNDEDEVALQTEAVRWLTLAADGGHPMAALELGLFYYNGSKFFAIDMTKARKYIKIAADAGLYDAIDMLDYMNENPGGSHSN